MAGQEVKLAWQIIANQRAELKDSLKEAGLNFKNIT
jgi:hypothetical protein